MTERDPARTAPASRRGGIPRRRTLLVVRGEEVEVRALPLAGEVTVGRSEDVDVRIDDPSISRLHLTITLTPGMCAITDRGSANGTTLREIRVPPGVPVQLGPNEAITAGDVILVLQEVGAPAGPPGKPGARPSGRIATGPEPVVLDPTMRQLYELAARVARGTISVLLTGETGTGKEVLCDYLHRASARANGPLVRINCAALSDSLVESELFGHEKGAFTGAHQERRGLIEAGDGGTVFLDEVGELPAALQAKLLRVLEEGAITRIGATAPRPVEVRFIAATNRDLEAEVEAGRFRRDLYFRLAGVVLELPRLADRPVEIVALARAFVGDAARALGREPPALTAAALAALQAYAWPGNVRELRNVLERAVLVADASSIDAGVLRLTPAPAPAETAPSAAPPKTASAVDLSDELARLERQRILEALDACAGNQTRAAEQLGMPLRTFVKRLTAYGIPRPRKRPR